jgi:hypothetical protein
VLEEVRNLKAELVKARADTAAAVALRAPTGLGGSVDRLRSHECYRDSLLSVGEIFICSWVYRCGCTTGDASIT